MPVVSGFVKLSLAHHLIRNPSRARFRNPSRPPMRNYAACSAPVPTDATDRQKCSQVTDPKMTSITA